MIKLLATAAATAAALLLAGCVTVIDASDNGYGWTGSGAQPFDGAKADCVRQAGSDEGTTAFVTCMADKGWTRTHD